MQSRPAAERPTRLSLLPVVWDLDEAAAGQPAVPPPPGPKSQMEWDDEEEVAPPRAQNKVRQRVREVMYRRKNKAVAAAAAAAVTSANAKRKPVQQVNDSATSTPEHGSSNAAKEKRKLGSVKNARNGIESRRRYELSSLRAHDELMLPLAFAQQRAFLPRKINTKHHQQETRWPKKLKEKASVRSLRSKTSLPVLRHLGGSSPSLRHGANSPRTPSQSPAFGDLLPPVPPIPMRHVPGSQESIPRPSPLGQVHMPSPGADARVRPLTAKKGQKTPPSQGKKKDADNEISPFLIYERLAPVSASPRTPSPHLTPSLISLRCPGSTNTLNTLGTSSSREFPSGPEDPFWDEAVARVKETVRRDQEKERREQRTIAKAERRVIRNISRDRDGRFKWAKTTIEMLIGKYDEHGWLPKKDPNDFNSDDWNFVLEVLNHKDTKALRDRLFKRPEWIEADKTRREKYEEEMRTNPTPEYLAAQKAKKDSERKDYGFRKILGLLTAEELEAERLKNSPPVGLGISNTTEPSTPLTTSTTQTSEGTDQSLQSEGAHEPEYRGRQVVRSEHEDTPSRYKNNKHGVSSFARHSVEQMTGVFNTESFNPRLSILGSEEVKQYIKKNPPIRPSPLTPTPDSSHFNVSLDPRQGPEPSSSLGESLHSKRAPGQRLQFGKKAASSNELIQLYNRQQLARTGGQAKDAVELLKLPTLGIHPALRGPDNATVSTARPAAGSQIPKLRKTNSSVAPLNSSNAPSSIRRQVIAASPPSLSTTPSLQRPPKPRKPSSAVKLPRRITATPPSAVSLSPVHEIQDVDAGISSKSPPLIRRPSTSVKSPRSVAGSCSQSPPEKQPLSSPLPLFYSRPSPSAAVKSQRPSVGASNQSPFDSLPQPLNYPLHSPSAVVRAQRPAVGSCDQSPPDRQPVSSPLPLSFSRPSPPAAAGPCSQSSPDRQPVSSPLPIVYSRPSPSVAVHSHSQFPSDGQPMSSPHGLSYTVLPPRPALDSSSECPPDRQPVYSPQQLSYSDPSPHTAVIPFATFSANNGDQEREYALYAPIPLPEHLPPRSLARLSRIPTFPDASDFLAAMEEEPDSPYELPATPVRSNTPVRSTTPMDRLMAKRSGIPVATGSNVAGNEKTNASSDRAAVSSSPSPFNIGPYFPPAPTNLESVQNKGQKKNASPTLHNVGPYFPSDPVNLHGAQTIGQKKEPSPILNVGPYFPQGPVSFGLDENAHQKKDEPVTLHNVGPHSPPGQISFQPHQTAGLEVKEPILASHERSQISVTNLSPLDVAMAKWRDYEEEEPLVQYRGNHFEMMVNPSGKQPTTEQAQEPPQNYGSHFDIMVDSSGAYESTTGQAQGQSQHHGSHFEIMVDSSDTHEPTTEQAKRQPQHHGSHFEIMVDSSDTNEPTTEQPQASVVRCSEHLPATPHMHSPAVVDQHTEGSLPSVQSSHASKGEMMSKQLRFASSSPGRKQQSSPELPSCTTPSSRSFSEKTPAASHLQPVAQTERSISLGNTQSSSRLASDNGAMFDAGKLAKKPDKMKYNVPATAPLRQGRRFEPFTPTKIRSPPADGSSGGTAPISARSRLRNKFGNVFNADPIEQQEFSQDQQPTSGNSGALDVDIEDVISAWQSSSPAPVQQSQDPRGSFQNQDIQKLRSDVGLEPISEKGPDGQKHPNHEYAWNTKKIMCRRIHNQSFVLPSLPSAEPGQPTHMADCASEYFVGSPYTDESAEAQRCYSCHSFCCQFTELFDRVKESSNDVVRLNKRRQAEDTVASLRVKKPNGVEEWESFLKCSQCERSYCPDCIRLCTEKLCQQPVCTDCVESTELCPIHNMF